jgi:serine/threonine protein kinase
MLSVDGSVNVSAFCCYVVPFRMHARHHMHCDLKAQNVMVDLSNTSNPTVVLGDLGMTKRRVGSFSGTRSTMGCGTYNW